MSSLRFLSLRTVLDIAHVSSSQDSRIVKLQKKKNSESAKLDRSRDKLDQSRIEFYRI